MTASDEIPHRQARNDTWGKKKKQTAKTFNMMAFKLAITALEQDCYYTRCFHENVTSMCIAVLKNAN